MLWLIKYYRVYVIQLPEFAYLIDPMIVYSDEFLGGGLVLNDDSNLKLCLAGWCLMLSNSLSVPIQIDGKTRKHSQRLSKSLVESWWTKKMSLSTMTQLVIHNPLTVFSSFAINLNGTRELVALHLLSYARYIAVIALWPFLTVPWVGLPCVIVVFPGHTHLLFVI